jgi:hypothetical protein
LRGKRDADSEHRCGRHRHFSTMHTSTLLLTRFDAAGWTAGSPSRRHAAGWTAGSPSRRRAAGWTAGSPSRRRAVGWTAGSPSRRHAVGWTAGSPSMQKRNWPLRSRRPKRLDLPS